MKESKLKIFLNIKGFLTSILTIKQLQFCPLITKNFSSYCKFTWERSGLAVPEKIRSLVSDRAGKSCALGRENAPDSAPFKRFGAWGRTPLSDLRGSTNRHLCNSYYCKSCNFPKWRKSNIYLYYWWNFFCGDRLSHLSGSTSWQQVQVKYCNSKSSKKFLFTRIENVEWNLLETSVQVKLKKKKNQMNQSSYHIERSTRDCTEASQARESWTREVRRLYRRRKHHWCHLKQKYEV